MLTSNFVRVIQFPGILLTSKLPISLFSISGVLSWMVGAPIFKLCCLGFANWTVTSFKND